MESGESWTQFIPVLISVECPCCGHKVERLVALKNDEAEAVQKAFKYKFAGIVTVKVLRGEELLDWIRGRR